MKLPPRALARPDDSSDSGFYAQPRLVTHIDEAAIAAVTQLYRERLPSDGIILDLMSSWVSHLPPEVPYKRIVGLGMNAEELKANGRLNAWMVHDLNESPRLPFGDEEFDAVACCVSVQYLTRPVEVWREAARACRPGAPALITFSNRCFPTKAVLAWQTTGDAGHAALVSKYLQEAGGWQGIEFLDLSLSPGKSDPLFAVVALRQ